MELNHIDLDQLKEIEELKAILKLHDNAKSYLGSFKWCISVNHGWYDPEFSIYEKIGVFLFEIEPIDESVSKLIWVIIGDLPTVYLDEGIKTSKEALELYCELMSEWVNNVSEGKGLDECYPVTVEPTLENADLLNYRIEFIKRELL